MFYKKKYTDVKSDGFTLVELLVVISIIAMLLAILLPSLSKARDQGRRTVCSNLHKQWALALVMYTYDNDDEVAYGLTGTGTNTNPYKFWFDYIEPYFNRKTNNTKRKASDYIQGVASASTEDRRCPAGKKDPKNATGWSSWVGVNWGADRLWNGKLCAPFFSESTLPLKTTQVKDRSWVLFMDSSSWCVKSPARWKWLYDNNLDGKNDSYDPPNYSPGSDYNSGRPEVHTNGCNVTLFDGHVKYMKFSEIWAVKPESPREAEHEYWYSK